MAKKLALYDVRFLGPTFGIDVTIRVRADAEDEDDAGDLAMSVFSDGFKNGVTKVRKQKGSSGERGQVAWRVGTGNWNDFGK